MSTSPNYCPNCGHQLGLTNHHHESETRPTMTDPTPPTEPVVYMTPRQVRKAQRAARPRLPHSTQLWMRFYMMGGTSALLLALFVNPGFTGVAIGLLVMMLVHGVTVTARMTYKANMEGHGRRHA